MANQVSGKTGLMSHDNDTVEVEITLALKKIQVLRLITLGSCNILQEIQNFIEVLRPITFGSCSFPQKIQNFVGILGPKPFRGCSIPQDLGVKPIFGELN